MHHNLASSVKVGDTIYNCFMDKLIVQSIYKEMSDDGSLYKIVFETTNNHHYDSTEVYFEDLYGESDDEKSWIEWAKNNKDFIETFDHIETMREIYKIGFCHGFEYKHQISFEEMMQK
jgi:hypothetical protein